MKIVYEDNYSIVCRKPSGQLSQPGDNKLGNIKTKSLLEEVDEYLEGDKFGKAGIINRLDAGVEGLVLFAKGPNATSYYTNELTSERITKKYLAIFEGELNPLTGRLEDYLVRDNKKGITLIGKESDSKSKKAVLEYKCLQTADGDICKLSLAEVNLITGRTHQIRAQFSNRGFPLIGDRRYGSKDGGSDIGLHSYYLSFKAMNGKMIELRDVPSNKYPWNLFDVDNIR